MYKISTQLRLGYLPNTYFNTNSSLICNKKVSKQSMPPVLGNSHPHNTIHLQTLRSWQTYKQARNAIINFYIQIDKLTFATAATVVIQFWTLSPWHTENNETSSWISICQAHLIRCACYKDLKIAELWFWIRANVCPVGQRGKAGMPGERPTASCVRTVHYNEECRRAPVWAPLIMSVI